MDFACSPHVGFSTYLASFHSPNTGESELAIGVNVNGCPPPLMWKKMVGWKDGQTE